MKIKKEHESTIIGTIALIAIAVLFGVFVGIKKDMFLNEIYESNQSIKENTIMLLKCISKKEIKNNNEEKKEIKNEEKQNSKKEN